MVDGKGPQRRARLPILRPATEAALFSFERIGTVLRLAWFPVLLTIALFALAFHNLVGLDFFKSIDFANPDATLDGVTLPPEFLTFLNFATTSLSVASALILSCVYVAMTRAAAGAGYEPPQGALFIALGGREIRFFLVRILYAMILLAAIFAATGVGAVVALGAARVAEGLDGAMKAAAVAPAAAIAIALVVAVMVVALRFVPALPIAAIENRIAFGDAWRMTKGNVIRIALSGAMFAVILQGVVIVLLLAILLPAGIVLGLLAAFGYAFAGPPSLAILALLAVFLVPGVIALAAFALAAEAAWPARVYAYLSDANLSHVGEHAAR